MAYDTDAFYRTALQKNWAWETDHELNSGPLPDWYPLEFRRPDELECKLRKDYFAVEGMSVKRAVCLYCDQVRYVVAERKPGKVPGFVCEVCQKRKEQRAGKDGYCPICGADVPPARGSHKRLYCDRHIRKNSNVRNYPPESALLLIVERDSWTCHLCLGRIEKLEDASRDHLVPKALGGSDEPDNLKAAHMICNSRRRHRPLEVQVVVSSEQNCR